MKQAQRTHVRPRTAARMILKKDSRQAMAATTDMKIPGRFLHGPRALLPALAFALALAALWPAHARAAERNPDAMTVHIHQLAALGDLRPGGHGAAAASAYIVQYLKDSGIRDIRELKTDAACYDPGQWFLEVSDSRNAWYKHESFWMPGSPATSLDGVQGKPVYVRDGADIGQYDLQGRVVVFDAVMPRLPVRALQDTLFDPQGTLGPRREDALAAAPVNLARIFEFAEKKQAAAVVGLLSDFPYDAAAFFAEPHPGVPAPPVPMVWVPRAAARLLLDEILRQRVEAVRVVSTGAQAQCADGAVAAFLPGRADRWFLVRAHFDGPFAGAARDASGAATALELAAHFSAPGAPRLEHGLIFLFSAPHPGGRHPADLLAAATPDLSKKIRLDLAIGRLGLDCEDKRDGLTCSALPALRAAVTERLSPAAAAALTKIIQKHNLVRTAVIDRGGPPPALTADLLDSLTGACAAAPGIPGIAFTSWPPYIASPEDAPDKTSPDQLAAIAAALSDLLLQLDNLK